MPLLNRYSVLEIQDRGPLITVGTRINFDIIKDNYQYSNKGIINVYNLTRNSNALIESETSMYNLKIGYENEVPRSLFIFQRDVQNGIHTDRKGPDVITKIEGGDAETAIKNIYTSSFKDTVNSEVIVSRCIDVLKGGGISLGHMTGSIEYKVINNGFTAMTPVINVLNEMADINDFEWFIQDNELFILKREETIPVSVTIDRENGLIGSVVKSTKKVEFTTWANTELKIGGLVILKSEILGELRLKLLRVHHVGDSWEGPWESRCEGMPL